MKIIIDNSNLFAGGGLQVAASFLRDLKKLQLSNQYFVVQSVKCRKMMGSEEFPSNFKFYNLDLGDEKSKRKRIRSVRQIENSIKPDCIFTLFGPSYHKSRFPKLVGFAIPYIIYPNSPFFNSISFKDKIYYKILSLLKTYCFTRFSDALIFETDNARKIFIAREKFHKQSFTVGNTINEIFFKSDRWVDITNLPANNCNILFLTANYPHKNMQILPEVITILKEKMKWKEFKFIITLNKNDLNFSEEINDSIEYLGNVELEKIPLLYKHSHIVFIPTLLEVFSATYLEAMIMKKPIVASDLGFSRDICGDAALFCDPVNAQHYAEAIIQIRNDVDLRMDLIKKGSNNLKRFGSSMDRTISYLKIISDLAEEVNYSN